MSADGGASDLDGHDVSLWSNTSEQFSGRDRLEGRHSTDIVIIGGGITGLSLALHLRERGRECAVIEADRPGAGASGRSGGLVAPDFVVDTVSSVCERLGRERGEQLARFVASSATMTFKLISDFGIECEAQRNGFVVPGLSTESLQLRARGEDWRMLGFPVTHLDEQETRAQIGTSVYTEALHFEAGGALNPLAYAVGLAEEVRETGAPIFVASRVTGLERTATGWLARTERGSIEGRRVILAANGGNLKLHAALRNTAVPMSVYEYATRALTADEKTRSMGNALPYTDRRPYMFSARLNHESRIISALPGLIARRKPDDMRLEASMRLSHYYPEVENPTVEFLWRGIAYLNRDLLPAVYVPEKGVDLLAVQACNGRGIAINTALGQELAAFIDSGDEDSLSVPITTPKKIRFYSFAQRVPAMLMTVAKLKDRWSIHRDSAHRRSRFPRNAG